MISKNEPSQHHKRKKILVDKSLQGSLIVAFVILECVILSVAIAYLYWRLGNVLEDFTYQVHFAGLPDIGAILLHEGIKVLAVCIIVNGAALLVVDRLWNRQIGAVLRQFRQTVARISALDFRLAKDPLSGQVETNHEVIALAEAWRINERGYLCDINEKLVQLEAVSAANQEQFSAVLSELAAIIDNASNCIRLNSSKS